jgi:hypothetical protein
LGAASEQQARGGMMCAKENESEKSEIMPLHSEPTLRIDSWWSLTLEQQNLSLTLNLGDMFSYDTVESLRSYGKHVEAEGEGPERNIILNLDDFDMFDSLDLNYEDYRLIGYSTVLPVKTPAGFGSGAAAAEIISALGQPLHLLRENGERSSSNENSLIRYAMAAMTPGVLVYKFTDPPFPVVVLLGLRKDCLCSVSVTAGVSA